MPNPVTHFEVVGKDGKKLQDFYGNVFGWQINADNPMSYGMVSKVEGGIAGGISGGAEQGGDGVTFYVAVANLEQPLQAIEKEGGRSVMGPDDVPGGPRIAQFTDPEGHRIGLTPAAPIPGTRH